MTEELLLSKVNDSVFAVWFLAGAALVFWMQAGFAMVEAGFTRAKNTGNILMKNLMDFCIGTPLYWLVGFGIMFGAGTAAFGWNRGAVRRGVLFVLLSFAMGGLVMSVDTGNFTGLVLCAGMLTGLCHWGFQGKGGAEQIVDVRIRFRGKQLLLRALVDTGNALRDPLTGKGVLVADGLCAWELAGLGRDELKDPALTVTRRRDLPHDVCFSLSDLVHLP